MKRTYRDYMLDILSSIQEIEEFVKGMDFEEFVKDRKTVNAVIRSLEVMGEAVKKIPSEIKDKYPEIPWKYIAGMRDKLIHEYHGVDLEIIWEVIEKEIPPDQGLRSKMKQTIKGFSVLEINESVEELAEEYVRYGAVPVSYPEDAYHIAVTVLNEMDYLLSWNFRHIVRRRTKDVVRMVNTFKKSKTIRNNHAR